jgi:hypothetical protein
MPYITNTYTLFKPTLIPIIPLLLLLLLLLHPCRYADGTMSELVSMLHKEEAGLTVDRSLEGKPLNLIP